MGGHEKREGSLVPPLFDAVSPCSELGVGYLFILYLQEPNGIGDCT